MRLWIASAISRRKWHNSLCMTKGQPQIAADLFVVFELSPTGMFRAPARVTLASAPKSPKVRRNPFGSGPPALSGGSCVTSEGVSLFSVASPTTNHLPSVRLPALAKLHTESCLPQPLTKCGAVVRCYAAVPLVKTTARCSFWCGSDLRAAPTGDRPSAEGAEPPSKMSLWVRGFSGGEGDSKHPLPLSGVLDTFSPWKKYPVGDSTSRWSTE